MTQWEAHRWFAVGEPDETAPVAIVAIPVFAGRDGQPLDSHNVRTHVWRPSVIATRLQPLRIHDLRHTAVSLMIRADYPLLTITKMIGHTSVAFTQDRYGHLFPTRASARSRIWIG